MKRRACLLGFIFVGLLTAWMGAAKTQSASAKPKGDADQSQSYGVRTLMLPDNNTGDVSMDYIAYDRTTNSLWVPGGNTGAVDVVDAATGKVRQISDFATKEVEGRGGKRILGPTSVSIGEGVVYIGNRGDSTVCAFNSTSLTKGACGHLDATPDGVSFVALTKEVWVTTPGEKSIRVLDSKTLEQKGDKLTFEGNPEGYAVDPKRGRFYTNMEDKDRTLAIDLKTRKTIATWHPNCGKGGPHGIGLDVPAGHLVIACDALAEVMDVGHDGAILSMVDTGDGMDDIHYEPATHMVYAGAARVAKLTIARLDEKGYLTVVAQVPTQMGARNATVSKVGTVFLAHGGQAKLNALVVVSPTKK
jgi:DNA-binding beta-propeller fold protein YncE